MLLRFLGGIEQRGDLGQPGRGVDLALFDLVHDVAELCEHLHLFGMVLGELDGLDDVPERNDGIRVLRCVLQQIEEPRFLEAQPDAEHEVGIGDPGDVLRARLEGVRVGPDGNEAEDVDVVAAHVRDPVRHDAGRGDDAQGLGGVGRLGVGWAWAWAAAGVSWAAAAGASLSSSEQAASAAISATAASRIAVRPTILLTILSLISIGPFCGGSAWAGRPITSWYCVSLFGRRWRGSDA